MDLNRILQNYDLPKTVMGAVRYGQGHINDTFCVVCQPQEGDCIRYILQGMSTVAFKEPEKLMDNFIHITDYLGQQIRDAGGDPYRETLSIIKTKDHRNYVTDENGKLWRLMPFIENTDCYQSATPELFAASAKAFGKFQYMLRNFPAETLHETIANFHNTEDRYKKFEAALAEDKAGRAATVKNEIDFVQSRKVDCSVALDAQRSGKLPLRVTHNDTKLNNILFDRKSGEGICIIDLDTTMPGLSIYDFGDSIRFGANHSKEDEKDLSKVNFDISLYEIYVQGYITGAQGALTKCELEYLPWGARLMTLECGIRFLTDYLDGDHYFRTSYPEQNLDRCRTQFKLVTDMEAQFDEMKRITAKYAD